MTGSTGNTGNTGPTGVANVVDSTGVTAGHIIFANGTIINFGQIGVSGLTGRGFNFDQSFVSRAFAIVTQPLNGPTGPASVQLGLAGATFFNTNAAGVTFGYSAFGV